MSHTRHATPSIRKEFARYAIPAVVGMVVSSLYNIIDGIFVGQGVGEMGLGAINIVYPFIMLEIALTMLITIGGANQFSKNRGRGDTAKANNIFLQSMVVLVAIGFILNLLVLTFTTTTCRLLGANDQLLPYAKEYIWWIALFGIIYMPGLGVSIFVRNDNAPRRELVGTISGTIVNIILDYLFIMIFEMGLAGAAIATGIGQTISVVIFCTHFLQDKRTLKIAKPNWNLADIKQVLTSGLPTFLMEFSQSAVSFSFNLVLLNWMGAVGVSYYSIVMYICSIFNMVLIGLTQGAQPIMSYNYGKKNKNEVEQIHKLATHTAIVCTTIIYIVIFFFGRALANIFVSSSPELTAMATKMMRYYFLAFFPIGITLINILYFQITERNTSAILLSVLRCIGFIQVSLMILPVIFGEIGIYLSFFVGEALHFLLSEKIFRKHTRLSMNEVSRSNTL